MFHVNPDEGFEPGEERPPQPPDSGHDETGLDLARNVAKAIAGAARNAPRKKPRRANRQAGKGKVVPKASGAHPDERDPQLLDTTLGRLIDDHGWTLDLK